MQPGNVLRHECSPGNVVGVRLRRLRALGATAGGSPVDCRRDLARDGEVAALVSAVSFYGRSITAEAHRCRLGAPPDGPPDGPVELAAAGRPPCEAEPVGGVRTPCGAPFAVAARSPCEALVAVAARFPCEALAVAVARFPYEAEPAAVVRTPCEVPSAGAGRFPCAAQAADAVRVSRPHRTAAALSAHAPAGRATRHDSRHGPGQRYRRHWAVGRYVLLLLPRATSRRPVRPVGQCASYQHVLYQDAQGRPCGSPRRGPHRRLHRADDRCARLMVYRRQSPSVDQHLLRAQWLRGHRRHGRHLRQRAQQLRRGR